MKYLRIFAIVLVFMLSAASCGGESTENISENNAINSTENSSNTEEAQGNIQIAASDTTPKPVRANHYIPDEALPYIASGTLIRWTEYEYNENGNKIRKTNYDGEETVMSWEVYEYNSDGKLIKLTLYSHPGSYLLKESEPSKEEVLIEWHEFEYDAGGNNTKETYYNPDGSIDRWLKFEYDGKGLMIKETVCGNDGSTDYVSFWNEYEYDENGKKISRIVYNGPDGSFSSHTGYVYNELREQFQEVYYTKDGEIMGTSSYSYQYDDEGRITAEINYSPDGNVGYWLEYQY